MNIYQRYTNQVIPLPVEAIAWIKAHGMTIAETYETLVPITPEEIGRELLQAGEPYVLLCPSAEFGYLRFQCGASATDNQPAGSVSDSTAHVCELWTLNCGRRTKCRECCTGFQTLRKLLEIRLKTGRIQPWVFSSPLLESNGINGNGNEPQIDDANTQTFIWPKFLRALFRSRNYRWTVWGVAQLTTQRDHLDSYSVTGSGQEDIDNTKDYTGKCSRAQNNINPELHTEPSTNDRMVTQIVNKPQATTNTIRESLAENEEPAEVAK